MENKPIEFSANGKTNAYSHYCSHVMHSKNYATCLHLIEERKHGRLDILYADCSAAIGKKQCPALTMRKEEVLEGRAIYFKERQRDIPVFGAFESGETEKYIPIDLKEIRKSPVTTVQPEIGGYSNAINNALKNEVTIKPNIVQVEPIEGESLIELAKRMLAKQQENV